MLLFVIIDTFIPRSMHYKYNTCWYRFTFSLPIACLIVEQGTCFGPQEVVPVATTTTDGILLCPGMMSGRHKEDHKNAKNTGTLLAEVYHRLRPKTPYILRFMLLSWFSRAQSSWHDNDIFGFFGDTVWQTSKTPKTIIPWGTISIPEELRS